MDKSKKIYIFIAEISNMLNMGQDTKTRSDNGTDGCSDESHKLWRREVRWLAPPPGDNILFIPSSTRAETNKISQIFTFTPSRNVMSLSFLMAVKFCVPQNFVRMFWDNKVR